MLGAGAAYGQDDLNRSVDIAKDYMPRVDRAAKLSIRPQMVDTTTLRPELEYTVHPQAWTGDFGIAPIRAAQMNTGTYNAQYPLYIKAGGGFPAQSIFDLYATSSRPGASGFGMYANHRGHYADIENFDGHKNRATSTANSFGIFGKASLGRMSLSGEVGWDYDLVSYYGTRGEELQPTPYGVTTIFNPTSPMQHYSTPRAAILFGHDFTDLSFLNFRLGADGYMLDDRYDHKETGGNVFFELGRRFDVHDLTLRAGVDTWKGGGNNKDAHSTVFSLSPGYRYAAGALLFRMGVTFAYEMPGSYDTTVRDVNEKYFNGREIPDFIPNDDVLWVMPTGNFGAAFSIVNDIPKNKVWFLPRVEFSLTLAGGAFNPYARLDSRLTPNSFRNLTAQNPYILRHVIMTGTPASQVDYRLRGGVSGSVAGMFSYNVFAGYNMDNNVAVFEYSDAAGFALGIYKKVKYLTFGAELEASIGSAFSLTVDGRYNGYSKDDTYFHNSLPQYEAGLAVRYSYRDKFIVRAGVKVRDGIDFHTTVDRFFTNQDENMKSDTSVDVSLAADYFLSDRLGVFIEGRNLANQDLYPLPFYRGTGMSVCAGVKLRF